MCVCVCVWVGGWVCVCARDYTLEHKTDVRLLPPRCKLTTDNGEILIMQTIDWVPQGRLAQGRWEGGGRRNRST